MRPPFALILISALACACGGERATPAPRVERSAAGAPEAPAPEAGDRGALLTRARASLARCDDGAAFLTLWEGLGAEEREALSGAEDTSVALQARWERERAVPPAEGDAPVALERAGVDRFLAFLGARAGVAPPTWWADILRGARWHPSTGATSYGGVMEQVGRAFSREVAVAGMRLRMRPTWHVDPGEAPNTVRLTWDFADSMAHTLEASAFALDLESPILHVAAMPVGEGLILMPFEVGGGGGAEVVRRYEGGRRLWETTVCAGGRTILGGIGSEMIELLGTEALVFAFGAESHAVWVDVLRVGDGSLAWRWNSDLWFARQYPRGND